LALLPVGSEVAAKAPTLSTAAGVMLTTLRGGFRNTACLSFSPVEVSKVLRI
jgi:hypothetical protein